MRIEILEENGEDGCAIKHGRERYYHGDHVTVERALGEFFCEHGLAKDLQGRVETGARPSSTGAVLVPHGARSRVTGESA